VKITDIRAVELASPGVFRWKEEWPPRRMESLFVRVLSDEGQEGRCITWNTTAAEFSAVLPKLREILVGRDPCGLRMCLVG
jgi:L-alanine-DL-glutamate epimerase-like enolase superfamily enzyme